MLRARILSTAKLTVAIGVCSFCAWSFCMGFAPNAAHAQVAKPKGLGEAGSLAALKVEPNLNEKGVSIRGRDSRQQIFVTGTYSSGQLHDHTRKVVYSSQPDGIVKIDANGMITPMADGTTTVTAKDAASGLAGNLTVTVSDMSGDRPINFTNQVVPIFTKLGCNGGGCHGKSSGQNGFKLSLLGFYPDEDYEYLVKEARGRRLFPSAPGQSLFLTKPVGKSPHGGGKRMEVDSYEYRQIARWIEQGMPYGSEKDPAVSGIKCYPEGRIMGRGSDQQITTLAIYSDGTTEDVTQMALYEPNDTEMAEVTTGALVKTLDLSGEVAVMARYQGQVSTFRATIPLGAEIGALPEPKNFIDVAVQNKLKLLGIPPSPVCDDATFIRRVSVDIAGKLPTEQEVREFYLSSDPQKRDKLIDALVDSQGYADLFANKWNMVLRNKRRQPQDTRGTYAFYEWIRDALEENKPSISLCAKCSLRRATWPAIRPSPGTAKWPRQTSRSKTRPSCSWVCGFSVPAATTIRSRSGARTTITGSLRSSAGSAARTAKTRASSASSTTMALPARPTRDRANRSSRRGWGLRPSTCRPSAIRGISWSTGCRAKTTGSSLRRWSTATGSISWGAAWSTPRTT